MSPGNEIHMLQVNSTSNPSSPYWMMMRSIPLQLATPNLVFFEDSPRRQTSAQLKGLTAMSNMLVDEHLARFVNENKKDQLLCISVCDVFSNVCMLSLLT